ncbi:MAG: MGMT family protein [Nanoarchaeota archaeon]
MPTPFQQRVYDIISQIPEGSISTYGAIARAMNTKAYQAVGQALNKNPFAPKVPCHRIVDSDGALGGFASGAKAKIAILKEEGISVEDNQIIDFKKKLHKF